MFRLLNKLGNGEGGGGGLDKKQTPARPALGLYTPSCEQLDLFIKFFHFYILLKILTFSPLPVRAGNVDFLINLTPFLILVRLRHLFFLFYFFAIDFCLMVRYVGTLLFHIFTRNLA